MSKPKANENENVLNFDFFYTLKVFFFLEKKWKIKLGEWKFYHDVREKDS